MFFLEDLFLFGHWVNVFCWDRSSSLHLLVWKTSLKSVIFFIKFTVESALFSPFRSVSHLQFMSHFSFCVLAAVPEFLHLSCFPPKLFRVLFFSLGIKSLSTVVKCMPRKYVTRFCVVSLFVVMQLNKLSL